MATLDFKGGAALKNALDEIMRRSDKAKSVSVGFLENARYPNGLPVAAIALIDEYGKPEQGQPPRPFFRRMIAVKSPGWGVSLMKIARGAEYDAAIAFGRMGELIKGQLQESINQFTDPPLAPSTIERKGFDKPLIETSHMLQSVDYAVE